MTMAGAWVLFGLTHLVLGSPPLRTILVARWGERTFVVVYSSIAAGSLALVGIAIAVLGGDGAAGPDVGSAPLARWLLGAVALAGGALIVAGLMSYARSPFAVLRRRAEQLARGEPYVLGAPSAVERITRHPFFVGTALFATAHALLATTVVSAIYFAGFAAIALVGIPLQERKFRRRYRAVFEAFTAKTSIMPLVAARRQASAHDKPPWKPLVIAVVVTAVIAALHWVWMVWHGAWLAGVIAVFGLVTVARQMRRH